MSTTAPPPPADLIAVQDSDDDELSELDDRYETEPDIARSTAISAIDESSSDGDAAEGDAAESDVWDMESLIEDAFEGMKTSCFAVDEDSCTPEEAAELKTLLRRSGEQKFLDEVLENRHMSPQKVLTAFGFRPPLFLAGAPPRTLVHLLRYICAREMMRRRKLPHVDTMEDVVRLLREAKNIIVLTGAGISTSLGIPDFRSKGSGLYSRLESLGLSDPQEVFDIDVFQDDPLIFYSIAKDILPDITTVSPTHAFIALLQSKGKLLTQYTQNIDNLEMLAGIHPDKLIQCHGSFASASCVKCKHKVPGEVIFPDLRAGRVARCERCLQRQAEQAKAQAATRKRKRKRSKSQEGRKAQKKRYSEDSSAEEEEMNHREAGIMKPDITFFGEQLPDTFHKRLVNHDRDKCDLLICIGTSLKVAPVSEIIGFLPAEVPQVYISKTPVNHVEFDVELLGSCDEVVVELCRRVGWDFEHEMIPKHPITVEVCRMEEFPDKARYVMTTTATPEAQDGQGSSLLPVASPADAKLPTNGDAKPRGRAVEDPSTDTTQAREATDKRQ